MNTKSNTHTKPTNIDPHTRKCWDCGTIARYKTRTLPECACVHCGSADTRPTTKPAATTQPNPTMFAAFVDLDDVGQFIAGPFESEEKANRWLASQIAKYDPAGWNEAKTRGGTIRDLHETLEDYQFTLSASSYAHAYELHTPEHAASIFSKNVCP